MAAHIELQRVGLSGWRTGLAPLLRKENRTWWASRRWLVRSMVWAVIINGLLAGVLFGFPLLAARTGMAPLDTVVLGLDMLYKMGGVAMALGAVILTQDAIIGERQVGVTEWLLSKPVSRSAYVLSKLLAHGFGALIILVGVQSALAYGQLWLAAGQAFPLAPYLASVAGLAVHTFLYVALTLMLGVLTSNRPLLLGLSLGILLTGWLAVPLGSAVSPFMMMTPWTLVHILSAVALEAPLPFSIWVPIGVTAFLAAICTAVTLAKFNRMEF